MCRGLLAEHCIKRQRQRLILPDRRRQPGPVRDVRVSPTLAQELGVQSAKVVGVVGDQNPPQLCHALQDGSVVKPPGLA